MEARAGAKAVANGHECLECSDIDQTDGLAPDPYECGSCGEDCLQPICISPCEIGEDCIDDNHHYGRGDHIENVDEWSDGTSA